MTNDGKSWVELIEKSYQFYAYVFTLYVICMGFARWYGQAFWRKQEETRRKAAGLPVAACFSNAEQGFTYTGLFQAGLSIVWIAATQMAYVAFMLAYDKGLALFTPTNTRSDIWDRVSILMYFPIIMITFGALANFFAFRRRLGFLAWFLPMCVMAVCVAATVIAVWMTDGKPTLVAVQLVAVTVLSLCMSYSFGMADGFHRADPEANYSLVNFELHQGAGFDRVWLYERTDSDYRFVSETGVNHIIPAANVTKITKV